MRHRRRHDDETPARPDGPVGRHPAARPWPRPTSYAAVLPRSARGETALPTERRARPRVFGDSLRGRLVDLVG